MSALRLAAIGEAMIELSLDECTPDQAQIGVAGDTLNTAIYLRRMVPGIGVSYVTCLGDDPLSGRIRRAIEDEGIESDLIGVLPGRSAGLYAISTDAAGERSFSYWRDHSAARQLFTAPSPRLEDLACFDVIYLSAITLAILTPQARHDLRHWLAGYRRGGGQVAFDSNYRPALWPDRATARREIAALWQLADIALPGLEDEQALFGDADAAEVRARIKAAGCRTGALKCGAQGPLSLGEDPGEVRFARAGKVVDSTAAGDSFNAGYLAALLSGHSQRDSLLAGHELALRVLGVRGAILPRASVGPIVPPSPAGRDQTVRR